MLVDKYRPKNLDELILPEDIKTAIKGFIAKRDPPHLLLHGPPGTGKTSLAEVVAREIFGEYYTTSFFDSNASSERGLDFVRQKIKGLAQQVSLLGERFKIIFLDEADALTFDAQNALRRIIEESSSETRFFLSCNRVGKIIRPIRSRCFEIEFQPLGVEDLIEMLLEISLKEGLDLPPEQLREIVARSSGDARKAVGLLEAVQKGLTLSPVPKKLLGKTFEQFLPLSFKIQPRDLLTELFDEVVAIGRGDMLVEIAEADFRMTMGTLGVLQVQALFFKLEQLKNKSS